MENKNTKKSSSKKIRYLGFFIVFLGLISWLISPNNDLIKPYSTVVEDKNGELLSATIASDGQWRFPPSDSIPFKFRTSIRLFEDEYFNAHPGFNPFSLLRAFKQNWGSNKVKSGGSTITMQLIRISRRKQRTYWQKLIEIILALKTELRYSKKEILSKNFKINF